MDNRGFTLFEMLIAVALMAVLLTATLGSGISLLKGDKAAREHKNDVQNIYAGFHRIERDLAHYLHSFKGDASGGFTFVLLETDDFDDAVRSGQKLVAYRVERLDGKVQIYHTERDAFMNTTPVETLILEVKNLLISYVSEGRKGSLTWADANYDPALVVVKVTDMGGNLWERSIPLMVRSE